MSEQHPTRNSDPLNGNLAAFVLIVSFIVMVGLLIANASPPSPQVNVEEPVDVALVAPTETTQPSSTPLPPTPTPLPTNTPVASATSTAASDTATATPQAAADAGLSGGNTNTTSYDPALVSHGAELYLVCSACHGADARGLPNLGKDLVESEFVHSLNDEELLAFVKTGRPLWDVLNTTGIDMPPKGGNPAFTDEDILAIIAYIRSLSVGSG